MTDFLEQEEDVIAALIEKAELQGFLTTDNVLEAFPDPEEKLDQVEEAFLRLTEAGIEVCDDKDDLSESDLTVEAFVSREGVSAGEETPIAPD